MQIKDKTLTNIVKGIENVKGENISIIDFTEIENTICKYYVLFYTLIMYNTKNYLSKFVLLIF